MSAVLYGLAYSPWTERARWALDHQRVAYRYREHVPMLGEPLLRWNARVSRGQKATVPLLVERDGTRVMDSIAIIERADRGAARKLVADRGALIELARDIDAVLHLGRGRVTARIVADPSAQRESAAAAVPAFLAPIAAPMAAMGARFIASKHQVSLDQERASIDALRALLTRLAPRIEALPAPSRASLTAEQIVLATALQSVRPAHTTHFVLGPAVRRAWTVEELASEFAGLIAWRDELYRVAR